jgi:isoprenylcysteine carboxyl methyltransferase (ICMT) family protein YpbQ
MVIRIGSNKTPIKHSPYKTIKHPLYKMGLEIPISRPIL